MNSDWDDPDKLAQRLDIELTAYRADPHHIPPDDLAPLVYTMDLLNALAAYEPRSAFAADTEARMLARARAADHSPLTVIPAERPAPDTRRARESAWRLPAIPRPVVLAASAACMLLVALSVLTATAYAGTPLYPLKRIVVGVVQAIGADAEQTPAAQINLQRARAALQRFNDAARASDDADAGDALTKLTQANQALERSIQQEPDATQRRALRTQYNDLLGEEYTDLRHALPALSWPVRAQITSVMRGLDAAGLIVVSRARVVGVKSSSSAKSSGQMTIIISGANFQPGAVLLVNDVNFGQVSSVTGSTIVAHLPAGQVSRIDSIGVGLPDGTAASAPDIELGGRDSNS